MADPAAMIHPGFAPKAIAKNGRISRLYGTVAFAAACLFTFAIDHSAIAQPEGVLGYEASSIGVADGKQRSGARALDEFGRVLGISSVDGQVNVAWINGSLHVLPVPYGFEDANATGISPTTGIIVGSTLRAFPNQAVIWTIAGAKVLQNLPGADCSAVSINDSGWAVGLCSWIDRAALWKASPIPIDLGDLGGGRASAIDINGKNEIVGGSWRTGTTDYYPFLWRNGEMIDLFATSSSVGEAFWEGGANVRAMNNLGEIVGEAPRAALYWYDFAFRILPEPNSCGSTYIARSINDSGIIVGAGARTGCDSGAAVLWERARGFQAHTIDDYLFRQPGVTLTNAYDVNSAGQIAASGDDEFGERRGYLVTPYQFELSEPAPGVAGERNMITVTNLEPNQRVILAFGTKEGAQPIGNGCLGGLVLIRDASTHQSLEAFADNSGVATFNVFVPKSTAGKTVRYQAVAPDECEISHKVEFSF